MQWLLPENIKSRIKNIAYNILPKEFNYSLYLSLYPDLRDAGITTKEQAIEHYILFGRNEGRTCFYIKPSTTQENINKTKHSYYDKTYTKQTINKYFDKIYVISLYDKEKNKQIHNYLNKFKIKYTVINAINGNNNKSIINYYKDYLLWKPADTRRHELDHKTNGFRLILGPGAIGLVKTYQKIYKEAIKNKYKKILILEEDCLLDKNFNLHLSNFMKSKKSFDLLFLGASHHAWNNPEICTINNTETKYYKAPRHLDGSFAIAYNCNILPELLKHTKPINAPIDSGPIREILKNNNSYILYPNIAIAETTNKSSISGVSRNLRKHKIKMHWDASNIDFTRGSLKTSIIIANYNSEKTIRKCIDSALSQTYTNTEIIVIDDASEDNSAKIVKKYAEKDKRIKLIELNRNIGAYKCRNIGLNNSNGFFITLLDSDDIFLSKKIEIDIYNYFNFHEYEIFFSNIYRSQNIKLNRITKDITILNKIKKEREPEIICAENECLYGHNTSWNYKIRFGLPSLFVDKSFFDKYGKWNEKYRYGMDLELIQRYIAKKYNLFIDHNTLWPTIYNYKADQYGIFLSQTMNYVSFPMNSNNATNICQQEERNNIHNKCDKAIQELIQNSLPSV